ncbi:MAG: hypothetical protein HC933_07320 [Pleurocapsa sp. SU_196_0]|nr:hypothetical protein [Pleurocapsa sp. SU_196_0]
MLEPFDFSTPEILDWELELIHRALDQKNIEITFHALDAASDDDISPVSLLEAILVGLPVSKDLPENNLQQVPGLDFEHRLSDGRWIRVKIAWFGQYTIVTAHQI